MARVECVRTVIIDGPIHLGTHADRPVSIEVRGDRTVVVKRYLNTSAAETYSVMTELWRSPVGARRVPPAVPEPLACDGVEIVMEHIAGVPLGTTSAGWSGEHGEPLAALIADLHCSTVVARRQRSAAALLRSLQRKHVAVVARCRSSALLVEFDAAMRAVETSVPTVEPMLFSHGDCSPRNVLVCDEGLRLIDLDRVQMAGPGRDLGYLACWSWVTSLLRGQEPSWSLGNEMIERYCGAIEARDPSVDTSAHALPEATVVASIIIDSARRTTAFHRAASLLRIAHGWSAMTARPDIAIEVCVEAQRLTSPLR